MLGFGKRKTREPAQAPKAPTPYELVFNAVAFGKIIEARGDSSGISWVTCVKDGLDVHVEVYSSGRIRELKVAKVHERCTDSYYRPPDMRKQVTFGESNDSKIAKAAYIRIREDSDAKVHEATREFFEGFGNG